MDREMTSRLLNNFLILAATIWGITTVVGCSTFTPVRTQTVTSTETALSTKTPVPSGTIASTPEPSPTPYDGPNILFYIEDDNKLFSIYADGSNQREITQGYAFSISPDKKKLIYRTAVTYGSDTDVVVVMDLDQEDVILEWNIPGYCEGVFMSSYFEWSPDSQKVAFTLTRHDGVDSAPNCELEYNYLDMGIYQIDLMSGNIAHPPLADEFLFDLLHANLSYSQDGSKLRIGTRGQTFDAETWERVFSEPFYDTVQLCNQSEKIGICNNENLCLYSQDNQITKYLTEYRAYPEFMVQSFEFVDSFKVFSDCSSVVYQTRRSWMPGLTPEPTNELVYYVKPLHVMSLNSANDQVIGVNVLEYFLTRDDSKIVFYEQDSSAEEIYIFVANSDGSNKHRIAQFGKRQAPIYGHLIVTSPTGERIAFVYSEGIAIIDLDGSNFVQLVNLSDSTPTDKVSLEILEWH